MTGQRPIGEDDLQAYVDGRLTPERKVSVEAYLKANEAAAFRTVADRDHREALRARLAFKANEPIPARLRVANIMAERRRPAIRHLGTIAAAVSWLIAGGVLGWSANQWIASPRLAPPAVLASNTATLSAIAAYRTYVVETAHPVEVRADQEAHLVQWLSRRLGKPLLAPDLSQQGYQLMGGRLLPAEGKPAALFMYDDAQGTRLTLYVRPGDEGDQTAFRFEAQGDVSAFSWIDQGLSYVVTAKTDRSRLLGTAEAVYRQLEQGSSESRKGKL
ncbi:anti-sigma factor family protein [Microvirga flavescens]|uniref:anti-sigma factor family protein n=1 Tax=Microvirga flavescens TaxID=2249811 RepID=UPI000DD6A672|nr:anti-sigma factor [Microvirga flavescens]